ncbi:MAG: outer membrane beta-barrel protein [Methylococcales bacterium]
MKHIIYNYIGLFIFSTLLLNSIPALSAEDEDGGIPVIGGVIYPSLGVKSYYNDNVLLQDKNSKDSFVIVTSPRAKYFLEGDITEFKLDMGIEDGFYTHSHNDNYFDLDANVDMSYYATERITFFGNAGYKKGHEARGEGSQTGLNALNFDHPHRYRLWGAEAGFKYGVEEVGMPRIESSYSHDERRYSNNRERTRFQERNEERVNTALFYQVLPNTSLLIESTLSRFSYMEGRQTRGEEAEAVDATDDLDSYQYSVLGGLKWQATYQTEGRFKIGWNEKFFDAKERGNSAGFSWELGVDWQPLAYTMLSLSTSQRLEEADGLGNDATVRRVDLSWKHYWREWFKTTTSFYYSNQDFSGRSIVDDRAGNSRDREDDDFGVELRADYEFRRWLTVGIDYSYSMRNSSRGGFDYERNMVGLHALFSL